MHNPDKLLMLSFMGTTLPENVRETLATTDVSGITLFRPNNYSDPQQFLTLTQELQDGRSGTEQLLIATDQEGGQLHAFGPPATMWPGNMALGAADDTDLTHRVGAAIGRELRAVGINVDYAPVADIASNPDNPATGVRSFGDDPHHVARHVAAMIRGIQSEGVAATMKHFPGKGASAVDSHHTMPVIDHDLEHLNEVELVPFIAAIDAGVKIAMTGHFALPAITGSVDLPCTLSYASNTELLRHQLGFSGPLISDALDMKALSQGSAQIIEILAAVRSGVDLLLMTADPDQEERVVSGLTLALSRGLITSDHLTRAAGRVTEVQRWVGRFATPSLDVIGSSSHAELALEAARRSITVIKDDASILPLDLADSDRVLVIEAPPRTLTPADTTDLETPTVGAALRALTDADIVSISTEDPIPPDLASYSAVVVVTDAAHLDRRQVDIVRTLALSHETVIAIARRTPHDILEYPDVGTYLCCWSINRPSASAVAEAMVGRTPISGRLPTSVGSYPQGHGIEVS
jgi:beta-N-acetylhexosaminidase